eukprot:sb/3461116/
MRCFLDTGSAVNLIARSALEKLPSTGEAKRSCKRLKDFGGNPIETFGSIDLPLKIGGKTETFEFIVCGQMDYDILLGHVFFTKSRCSVNYESCCVEMEGATPTPFNDIPPSVERTCTIRIPEGLLIKKNAVTYITGSLAVGKPAVGVVKPSVLKADQGVLIAAAIAEAANGQVILKCINLSEKDVRLPKGARVAKLEPVPDYNPIRGVQDTDEEQSVLRIEEDPREPRERWAKEELYERLKVSKAMGPRGTKLSFEEETQLKDIIWENRAVFSYDDYDIGCCNMYSADIGLKPDATARWTHPMPVPYKLRPEMERNIREMMQAGVVETLAEPSDWNSPIFLVKKKTPGAYRLVADLRNLNKECVGDSYPLPNLNHVLDRIGGDTLFSSLDLSKGFWQVPYTEESKNATAFLYRGQQLCFGRMVMGHRASSSKFTRMMQKLLGTLPIDQVVFFIDDLFLSSSTATDHLDRLEKLLRRLGSAGLKVSTDKTKLLQQQVEFVGVAVTAEGVKITEDRVKDLMNLRAPESKKEVMKVMGALNYVRKWVKNYSSIARPIHALLRGTSEFRWTEECEEALLTLKMEISRRTLLAVPDPEDPFESYEVVIDASIYGYGATLSQELTIEGKRERRIVAFYSRATPSYKRSRGQTRLEFDAMVYALEHWRVYLANTKFTVVTDCKSLLQAQDTLFAKSNATLIRKTQILADYNCVIRHIGGEENQLVDFLSRFPHMARSVEIGVQTEGDQSPEEMCTEKRSVAVEQDEENLSPAETEEETEIYQLEEGFTSAESTSEEEMSSKQVSFANPLVTDIWFLEEELEVKLNKISNGEVSEEEECTCNDEEGHKQVTVMAVTEADKEIMTREEWASVQKKDDILEEVRKWVEKEDKGVLQANRAPRELFTLYKHFPLLRIEDEVLERRWKEMPSQEERWLVVVPSNERERVLKRVHEQVTGHGGAEATTNMTRRFYYWPNMIDDAQEFIAACTTCGRNKQPRAYSKAAMATVIYHRFNDAILIDHIVPGSSRTGNTAILTITDAWSNFVVAVAVKTQASVESREAIVTRWCGIFGIPREIVADNHKGFRGAAFTSFFEQWGVKITFGSPYTAKSTARAEATNKRINAVMRALLEDHEPAEWDSQLQNACFILNSMKSSRTGYAPYKLVFGTDANIPETLLLNENAARARLPANIPEQVYQRSKQLRRTAWKVRKKVNSQIASMKRQYDKKIWDPEFTIGERVYVKINCPVHKFAPRWKGPFSIREVISPYLYTVQTGRKTSVVSVAKLKPLQRRG